MLISANKIKSLFASESYKKGYLVSSFFSLFAKSIGFFTSIILAFYFGATTQTDFYFVCISFVTVISAFFSSLTGTILIPEAMRLRQTSKSDEQLFLNYIGLVYFVITLGLAGICLFFPEKILSFTSSFKPEVIHANIKLFYLSLLILPLITVNSLFIDILSSYKYFTVPIGLSAITNVAIIAFIFFFHKSIGVISPMLGWLAAVIFQFILLLFALKKILHWKYAFNFFPLKKQLKTNILLAQAGNLFTSLTNYFPVFLLSGFSNGALSTISYGLRFSDAVTNLIIIQFATILGIKLNDLFAKNQVLEVNQTVQNALKSILFIVCPVCVMTIVFSNQIISILFCHGSFKQENVNSAASYLQIFIAVLPFTIMNVIVARLFMAAQKISKSFVFQIIMSIIMSLLVYCGIRFYKVPGYPLAVLGFYVLNTIAAYIIVKKHLSFIDYWVLCKTLLLFFVISIVPAIPIYFIHSFNNGLFLSIILIGVYSTSLILINSFFKFSPDVDLFIQRLVSRFNGLVAKKL